MKKNIVFFSGNDHTPWGGSEELWAGAARALLEKAHIVQVYARQWPRTPDRIEKLQVLGAQVHFYTFPGSKSFLQRAIDKVIKSQELYKKLFLTSMQTNPDLYVISLGNPYGQAQAWLRELKKARHDYVLIINLASEIFWPSDELLEECMDIYREARKVYFLAHNNLNIVERQLGIRLPNAELVYTPRTVDFGVEPTWPKEDGFFHVACAGRLSPLHKGQDLLFEVMKQDKWRQRNIRIKLYGEGENVRSLKRLKESYGLEQISFHSFENDVRSIWNANHAAIFPSRMEGMPLALIEALLCHRMAIVTDIAGHAEVVKDNETGFIAEAPTVKHIDEALERAWAQRHRWQEMGLKAGADIRTIVPEKPAEIFAGKLEALLAGR